MTFTGADADALDDVAALATAAGAHLAKAQRRLEPEIQSSPWSGRNADVFRRDWSSHHRPALAQASSFLADTAAALHRHATEQREASAGPGGGLGGTGSGPIGETAEQAVDRYERLAYEHAGIDPDSWDPSKGVDGNRANIEAVYEYYAQLYRDNPYMLWAGMAAMIGPSFYAGFADLDQFADMVKLAKTIAGNPALLAGLPAGLAASVRGLADLSGDEVEKEFRWYEKRFLKMQRDIFIDQARQHEAYQADGLEGIRKLREAGLIKADTVKAWEDIDEGRRTHDQALIEKGNEALLKREQKQIIDADYGKMYDHKPTGKAVTYLATAIGQPSIPGAKSYAEVFPLKINMTGPEHISVETPHSAFGVPLPHAGITVHNPASGMVKVSTPLPDGNVALYEDRWGLIKKDTLPAYLDMSRQERLDVLGEPIGQRMDDYRMVNRLDDIGADLLTNWGIELHG